MVKPKFEWQRNRLHLVIEINEKHDGCFVVVIIVFVVVSTTQRMLGEKQRVEKLPSIFFFLPLGFSVNGINMALEWGEEWEEGAFSGLQFT